MAIKCISKNCPFADTNPDNCHFIDCCDFAVEQPTNADRIRAMRDDELKEFICSILQCKFCKFEGFGGCELLEWLQQPADENDYVV